MLPGDGEDDIAAVEQRPDIGISKAVEERSQIRHRDTLRASHVDASKKRHATVRHRGVLALARSSSRRGVITWSSSMSRLV
jgi:hypothetical protein